jgi:hypothetical protein
MDEGMYWISVILWVKRAKCDILLRFLRLSLITLRIDDCCIWT